MALAIRVADDVEDEPDGAGKAEKRPGAFRTISEVAEDLAVPQHVLRFWESRFGQVRPLKRAGGRRYYRPDDIDLLKGIRRLLHGQGYTIKGAQRVLKQHGVRFVQEIGRGEAEAGAPPPAERDTEAEGEATVADPASASGETALHAALRELHACRQALIGLRLGIVGEDASGQAEAV